MAHARPISTDALSILLQPGAPVMAKLAVGFAVLVTLWATRRRTRRALSQLDARLLRDVGLTPTQANQEARRVFWKL